MNATENDIKKQARARTCQFGQCQSPPDGPTAKYCRTHRKELWLRSRARLRITTHGSIQPAEAEMLRAERDSRETSLKTAAAEFRTIPNSRFVETSEFCPERDRFVEQILARRRERLSR